MNKWLFTGFLLFVFASSVSAQGIAARNRAESLAGLQGVHVIVAEMPATAIEAGLTTAVIKSAVESKLKARGVPILGLGALTMDPRAPSLLVKVDLDLSDPVYFYYAQVQFFQNVTLMTGADILTSSASASTWQAGTFARIGKFRINTLPQEVNKLVDAFATDYLKQNVGESTEEEMGDEMDDEMDDESGSDPDSTSN
jgi:hypothetical protein